MALQITGQPQGVYSASQKSGTPVSVNTGWHNELLKSDLLPRYSYLTFANVMFAGGQTAFAALSAVGTAVTGLTLFNPTGSGRNLVVISIEAAFTPVTLATVAVTPVICGVAQPSTPTGVSALTPASTLIGTSATPVAKLYSAATIAASPAILRVLGNWQSTVLTTSGGATASANYIKDDVAGALVIPPGTAINLAGLGTVADATVCGSVTWAELPI